MRRTRSRETPTYSVPCFRLASMYTKYDMSDTVVVGDAENFSRRKYITAHLCVSRLSWLWIPGSLAALGPRNDAEGFYGSGPGMTRIEYRSRSFRGPSAPACRAKRGTMRAN